MNELIKRLQDKNYVRAFGLMSPEEQKCFEKVTKHNCLFYSDCRGWVNTGGLFMNGSTYAIKPDYQPEPEYVDLEIEEHEGFLGVWRNRAQYFLPHRFTHLHCLPSLPNFEGFWYQETDIIEHKMIMLVNVATLVYEGHKVYPKFRKG